MPNETIPLSDSEIVKVAELKGIWSNMISRCYSPRNGGYPDYGGRGITVCDRWRISVVDFIRDMWPRPDGMTLERKNNNLGYSPENCRWATPDDQNRNRRVSSYITLLGQRRYLMDVAAEYGIQHTTIRAKLRSGLTPEQAVGLEPHTYPLLEIITFQGQERPLNEVAEENGMTPVCVRKRIRNGMTPEQAVATPLSSRGGNPTDKAVDWNGEKRSLKSLASEFHQKYPLVHARIHRLGWTLKEALRIDPPPGRRAWNDAGLTPEERMHRSRDYNKSYRKQKVEARQLAKLNECASYAQSANISLAGQSDTIANHIAIRGGDLIQICNRIRDLNWTPEEAFGIVKRRNGPTGAALVEYNRAYKARRKAERLAARSTSQETDVPNQQSSTGA
jgi:hypothetical protein